jgi:CDP-diacylglycerol--glycerol-3-phosphate 3-phosphatidyltransferase
MNLPNKLTVLRILLVPVFICFMYVDADYGPFLALIIFCIASFTDFLDGNIARKNNMVTTFGKFMDPLADKMLTTTALLYLCLNGFCHEIVIVAVLIREFAVSGIRMAAAAASESKVIARGILGKVKTVFQMVAIILALLDMTLFAYGTIDSKMYLNIRSAVNIMMWVMALLTLISGAKYILPNKDLISETK